MIGHNRCFIKGCLLLAVPTTCHIRINVVCCKTKSAKLQKIGKDKCQIKYVIAIGKSDRPRHKKNNTPTWLVSSWKKLEYPKNQHNLNHKACEEARRWRVSQVTFTRLQTLVLTLLGRCEIPGQTISGSYINRGTKGKAARFYLWFMDNSQKILSMLMYTRTI